MLQSVAYADTAKCNLFSLTYMLKKGWKMSGDDNGITITKGRVSLKCKNKERLPICNETGTI